MDLSVYPPLSLPPFDHKITESDGKALIFDVIRKKNVVLTPEEWVRQHVVHLLLTHYHYPKSLFRVERGLRYNQLDKRSDILIHNRDGNPYLLIECKSTEVAVNQSVIEQVSRYNKSIQAPFFGVTNGLKTYCFQIDFQTEKLSQLRDLPAWPH